jgi:hypothetical protein
MLFELQYSHSTQSWAMFYVLQGSGTMDIFDILWSHYTLIKKIKKISKDDESA